MRRATSDRFFALEEHKEVLGKRPTVALHTRYGDLFFCVPPQIPSNDDLLSTAFGASFKNALSQLVRFKCKIFIQFMREYWSVLEATEAKEIRRVLTVWIGPGGIPLSPVSKVQLLLDSITLNADELRGRYIRTALGQMLDAESQFLDDVFALDERGTTILQSWYKKHGVTKAEETVNLLAFHCDVLPWQIESWFNDAESSTSSSRHGPKSSSTDGRVSTRSSRRDSASSTDDSSRSLTLGQLASILQQLETPESLRPAPPQLTNQPVGKQFNPKFSPAVYPTWRWVSTDITNFDDSPVIVDVPPAGQSPHHHQQLQRLAVQQHQALQQEQETETATDQPRRVLPYRVPAAKPVAVVSPPPRATPPSLQVPVTVYNVAKRYTYDIQEEYLHAMKGSRKILSPAPAVPSPPPLKRPMIGRPLGRPSKNPKPQESIPQTPYIAEMKAKRAAAVPAAPKPAASWPIPRVSMSTPPQPQTPPQMPHPPQQRSPAPLATSVPALQTATTIATILTPKSTIPSTPEELEELEYERKRERRLSRLLIERQRRENEKQDDDDDPLPPAPYIVALPPFSTALESKIQRGSRRGRPAKHPITDAPTESVVHENLTPLTFADLSPCLPIPAPCELGADEKDWFAGVVTTCSLTDALDEELEKELVLKNNNYSSPKRAAHRRRKVLNPTRSAIADLTLFRLQQVAKQEGSGYALRKRVAEKANNLLLLQQQQKLREISRHVVSLSKKRDRPQQQHQSASVMPPPPKRAKMNEQNHHQHQHNSSHGGGRGRPSGASSHQSSSSSARHGYVHKGGIVDAVMERQIKEQLVEKVRNYGFTSFGTVTPSTTMAPQPLTHEERESYQLRLKEQSRLRLEQDNFDAPRHRGVTRLWLKHTLAKKQKR
jgi:hypothetical protein